MNYEGILEFKGTWRNYQARVLEHADRYMADGKIHIVAAPGSGKTTLILESLIPALESMINGTKLPSHVKNITAEDIEGKTD